MFENRRWALPPKFHALLRRGRKLGRREIPQNVSPIEIYEDEYLPGTAGQAHWSDPGIVTRLTGMMFRQHWTTEHAYAELMKPRNCGGMWLRRQPDSRGVFDALWTKVSEDPRNARPCLPMRARHSRIKAAIQAAGPDGISLKQLIEYVGHGRDANIKGKGGDVELLAAAGVIKVEKIAHGKVTWYRITLCSTARQFWDASLEVRRELARKIAKRRDPWGGSKGGKASRSDTEQPVTWVDHPRFWEWHKVRYDAWRTQQARDRADAQAARGEGLTWDEQIAAIEANNAWWDEHRDAEVARLIADDPVMTFDQLRYSIQVA